MKKKLPNIVKNKKIRDKKKKKPAEEAAFTGFDLTGGQDDSFSADTGKKSNDFDLSSFGITEPDAFEVSVRNADPILKRPDEAKAAKIWLQDLKLNLATAGIVMAMLSLLMTAADIPIMIIFCIPAFVVVMALSTLESFEMDRVKLYTALALGVILIIAAILLRKYIGSGLALITGHLYDTAEEAQAYLYNRFSVGEMGHEHPNRSMHFASAWASALIGLLVALPPAEYRRTVAVILTAFSMLMFAYYGIIPSWICIAVLAAALIFAMSKGRLIASLPVLLIVALAFGAVMFIDPGESYGISRADENFRDRFALRSTLMQESEESAEDLSMLEDEETDESLIDEGEEGGDSSSKAHKGLVGILVLLAILAALGALAYRYISRIRKKQARNRKGIDSSDPRTAMIAMFPYAVRWLQPAGIETEGKPFSDLIKWVRSEISDQYGDSFEKMYGLWEEAAYSDHEVLEESRSEMDSFLKETIDLSESGKNQFTKIKNRLKYAL